MSRQRHAGNDNFDGDWGKDMDALNLHQENQNRTKRKVRNYAWEEDNRIRTSESLKRAKKANKKPSTVTVCSAEQVKKDLNKAIEAAVKKHGLNMYEKNDIIEDLKKKSIVSGQSVRGSCDKVKKAVNESVELILQTRAATVIQRATRDRGARKRTGSKKKGSIRRQGNMGTKKCSPGQEQRGLATMLEDLKLELSVLENRQVLNATKKAMKGTGACTVVSMRKLAYLYPDKFVEAYKKLPDSSIVRKKGGPLAEIGDKAVNHLNEKTNRKCLKQLRKGTKLDKLNKDCLDSKNVEVQRKISELKKGLENKIKKEQAKIAKEYDAKAERDRQASMAVKKKKEEEKIAECINEIKILDTEAAVELHIKGKSESELDEILSKLQTQLGRLNQLKWNCKDHQGKMNKNEDNKYATTKMMASTTINSNIKQAKAEKKAAKATKAAAAAAAAEAAEAEKTAAEAEKAEKIVIAEIAAAKKDNKELEKKLAAEKAAEEQRNKDELAAKVVEEKRIAEEKAVEEKRIAEEKAAEEKRITEEKAAEELKVIKKAAAIAAAATAKAASEKKAAEEQKLVKKLKAKDAEDKRKADELAAKAAEDKRITEEKLAAEKAEKEKLVAEKEKELKIKQDLIAAGKAQNLKDGVANKMRIASLKAQLETIIQAREDRDEAMENLSTEVKKLNDKKLKEKMADFKEIFTRYKELTRKR